MNPRQRRFVNCFIVFGAIVTPALLSVEPVIRFLMRRFWPMQYRRQYLDRWALEALEDHRYKEVETYASEFLEQAAARPSFDTGEKIYAGNQILGLARLRQGDVEQANEYLLKAGQTPGCFGLPSMLLARELLQQGETEAVLQYLDLVEVFTLRPQPNLEAYEWHVTGMRKQKEMLDRWKTMVRAGRIPDDKQWQYRT